MNWKRSIEIAKYVYAFFMPFKASKNAEQAIKREFYRFKVRRVKQKILFFYSSRINPPGLGDFALELICARFYESVGYDVTFILEEATHSHYSWNFLNLGQRRDRFKDFVLLASDILPSTVKFEVIQGNQSHINLNEFLFFSEEVKSNIDHNVLILGLLRKIVEYDPTLSSKMLLDSGRSNPSKLNVVGMHIRSSMNQTHRNPSMKRVLSDIHVIQKVFPNAQIKIFSEVNFYSRLNMALIKNRTLDARRISYQESSEFNSAFQEALQCDFWFQRDGGGIGVAAIFSTIPYLLISSQTIAARIYGSKSRRYGPIENRNQMFLLNPFRWWYNKIFTRVRLAQLRNLILAGDKQLEIF